MLDIRPPAVPYPAGGGRTVLIFIRKLFKIRLRLGSLAPLLFVLAEWGFSLIGHPGARSVLMQKGLGTRVGNIKRG